MGASTVPWISRSDETNGSNIACRKVVDVAVDVSKVVSIFRAFRVLETIGPFMP